MSERKKFATQKQIWWELDKLCILLAAQGCNDEATIMERTLEILERPSHDECKRFFAMGY